ncbi:MAG: patatin-like phospholipase family protein [Actinomycetota bacterium]
MTRVGLVLGAGGVVGQAYHAGVLAALEHDLGWDPRTADIIVGSSAGSVTGTLLRLGVPATDLAAWAAEAPLSVLSREGKLVLEELGGETPEFPPLELGDVLRWWRMPSAALVTRTLRRPWAFRPGAAAATLLPSGRINILEHAHALEEMLDGDWPPGLWICTARRSDGGRVVFGRPGAPDAGLPEAVAASCAIPGYFAPIRINGVEYFDGGVYSPSNADVLRREDLDLVIVVSPMSAVRGRSRGVDAMWRRSVHRRLSREVATLRAAGMTVVRFEPGRRTLPAMGLNAMSVDRSDAVVQRSFIEAGKAAAYPKSAAALAAIATRSSRRISA